MKTMRRKTARGVQAALEAPNSHGTGACRNAKKAKTQRRHKPQSGSRQTARSSQSPVGDLPTLKQIPGAFEPMNAVKLEKIIQDLGNLRQMLAPSVPVSLENGE